MSPPARNELGTFLRSRRRLVRPGDVGLATTGQRRVPGLRREEAAMLAGISHEYYLRLEQGRDQHPSAQVLAGLARALLLDESTTRYLFDLARPRPPRGPAPRPPAEQAPEGVVQLLEAWAGTPAYVQGRTLDVLAANRLARALSPIFTPGVNLVRRAFLDPAVRELYRDWAAMTEGTVAGLRAQAGADPDPALTELVAELSRDSERFADLWDSYEVRPKSAGRSLLDHPIAGPLDLRYEKLAIGYPAVGQQVVVYHAEPGSPTAAALAALAVDPSEQHAG